MDVAAGSDLRLGFLLLLNGIVALSAWQFVRRLTSGDWLDRAADAGVLFYLVQYAAVCLPGVAGVLGPISMAGTAVVLCAAMWVGAAFVKQREGPEGGTSVGWAPGACLAFVVGYVVALAVYYRHLPVISNDALTYHFPAAAQWLRTGRIGVFDTWFFNPANAYSPLAGSAFIAWLIAPLGNDTIASFVQVPALVALWLVVVRVGREIGLGATVASLAGAAVVTAQPFIRAAMLSKDDLFVAMFFAAAVAGCSRRLAGDRLGPWRVGVTVGLLLATKYTALMCVPVLLLAADGPVRAEWGWRRWGIAAACVVAVAGAWYGRNLVAYHNPVFPVAVGMLGHTVLPGLLTTEISPKLRSVGETWRVLTGVDDAMPAVVLVAVMVGWVAFAFGVRKRMKSDSVARVVALGPIVGTALFFWKAPYAEIRFLYPVLTLLVVAFAGGVVGLVRDRRVVIGVVGALLVLTCLTGLPIYHGVLLLPFGIAAGVLVAVGSVMLTRWRLDWTHGVVAGFVAAAGLAVAVYVYWPAYVRQSAELAVPIWEQKYGPGLSAGWGFVRALPENEKVAYANTYLVYPLMGFEPVRAVEYVPARRGVERLGDLPGLGAVTGDEMVERVAQVTNGEADEGEWLGRVSASGVKYFFVEKRAGLRTAPELGMADKHPERFRVVFDNDAARVYEIR